MVRRVGLLAAALLAIALTACGPGVAEKQAAATSSLAPYTPPADLAIDTSTPIPTPSPTPTPTPIPTTSSAPAPPPPPPAPVLSSGQQNALSKAEDYLGYTAFSRSGLIDQLKYEGFSVDDATWAVDHVSVDWNQQAVAKAKAYLGYTSFSKAGLIQQLEYDGFTAAQAQYGADAAY